LTVVEFVVPGGLLGNSNKEPMAITDEKEDEKAGQNLDEVDNMQADFSDYHAISNMKSSIPVSFGEHV
jgi:hypothetical protein